MAHLRQKRQSRLFGTGRRCQPCGQHFSGVPRVLPADCRSCVLYHHDENGRGAQNGNGYIKGAGLFKLCDRQKISDLWQYRCRGRLYHRRRSGYFNTAADHRQYLRHHVHPAANDIDRELAQLHFCFRGRYSVYQSGVALCGI